MDDKSIADDRETGAAALTLTSLSAKDRSDWRRLWTAYLDFYETQVPEEVYATTWSRLLSGDPAEFSGIIAKTSDGASVGLAHYVSHRHCWRVEDVVYLQDLYVDPSARGAGVGRALIEAVYAAADDAGTGMVYWLTQDFNKTARRLYDHVGVVTPFIKYTRS